MNVFLIILGSLVGTVIGFFLFLIIVLCISALVAGNTERTKESKYYRFLINFSIPFITFFSNVKIKFNGKEKLEQVKGRFLLVCNHRSNYDPIVVLRVMRKQNVSFISKRENFDIPIVGRVVKRCCFMAIDRVNPRNAIITIRKASNVLKDGQISMCVYPEGTRSKDCKILPFHDGVFKIAQQANVPIVVATVEGTENVSKNSPFRRTNVNLNIVDIITAEQLKDKSTHEIGEIVKADFEKSLGGCNQSLSLENGENGCQECEDKSQMGGSVTENADETAE